LSGGVFENKKDENVHRSALIRGELLDREREERENERDRERERESIK
jgi:hypothetical protein